MAGQGAIRSHQLALYWSLKLGAILLALFASVTLTTVWEEWVIWRLSSRPQGKGFFGSVLRTNLDVLVLVMAVPPIRLRPHRLIYPAALCKPPTDAVAQAHSPPHS